MEKVTKKLTKSELFNLAKFMRNYHKFQLIPLLLYLYTHFELSCIICTSSDMLKSLPNSIEFIVFSASPRDDNEFP